MLRKIIGPFEKISLAVLSSCFIALSFPKWNLCFLAWIALIPLLFVSLENKSKPSFLLGWLTGTAAFCGILYWIIPTFLAAGISVFLGILALILLSGYIGLFYGCFSWGAWNLFWNYPEPLNLIFMGCLWTALEYARNHFLSGFPWGLLGYSQWKVLPFIQISEWTAVYGISFMLAYFNFLIYSLIQKKKIKYGSLLPLLVLISANLFLYFRKSEHSPSSLSVSILQGNIDQYKKWSEEYVNEILSAYLSLVDQRSVGTDLAVWPETAVPGWLPQEKRLLDWVQKTAAKTKSYNLIGSVTEDSNKNYNSAFLLDPNGKIAGRYDKIHLVPFGEFVPFQPLLERWFPVLNQLGNFESGVSREILEIPKAKIGINICYEVVFPELARKQVLRGAQILVNITNDGWYLDTAAPEQHFSMNVFRAVENRRTLIRAANTGISGIIDEKGRILQRSKLNTRILLEGSAEPKTKLTFYTRFGDIFAWSACLLSILALLLPYLKHENHQRIIIRAETN